MKVVQVSPPQLTPIRSGAKVILSWPTTTTGFFLQSATTLSNGGDWQVTDPTPTEISSQNMITVGTTNADYFFRLRGL